LQARIRTAWHEVAHMHKPCSFDMQPWVISQESSRKKLR